MDESNVIGQPGFIDLRDIIAKVLELVKSAWAQVLARKEINNESLEPDIAGCLGREMIAQKKHWPPPAQFRLGEESGTRSSPEVVRPDGRIDIMVTYSFNEEEYFGIECKRVSGTDNELARLYVDKGVKRISSGKYSRGHKWAALMGFVIDGDSQGCADLIKSRIEKAREDVHLLTEWTRAKNFGNHEHLYTTRHKQRNDKNAIITVLHLLLDVA